MALGTELMFSSLKVTLNAIYRLLSLPIRSQYDAANFWKRAYLPESAAEAISCRYYEYTEDSSLPPANKINVGDAHNKHLHKMFSNEKKNVEDEDRSGRPSTLQTDVNLTRVRELVLSDRRLSMKMTAEELYINR
ncbi:hypothetical protein J6590_088657 [Homalodisca vitripennis]|nr:hypothetical protein J6590_088657 [Homalodisca vitripennis]